MTPARQIKGGYLLRHKKRMLGPSSWREQWVVLYDDSTLCWYKEKGRPCPEGSVRVRESPDLLAVSQYTQRIPDRPDLPKGSKLAQLLAVGTRTPSRHKVHWLLARSMEECHEWMTAISRTLPPLPPPKQNGTTANGTPGPSKNEGGPDMKTEGTVDLPSGLLAGAGVSQAWGGWGHGGGWAHLAGVGLCSHGHHVAHVHQHAPTPHAHASAHAYDHHPASAAAYHQDCTASAIDSMGHHDVDLGDLDFGGLDCLADFSF